jgi:hypothetical protein
MRARKQRACIERLERRRLLSLAPDGAEFRVNTFTTSDQGVPAIAVDADGDCVVVWESFAQDGSGRGIYAQRYNAAGVPQGPEFRVNTSTTGDQRFPAVAMDADGDFVVVWDSDAQDGSGSGIFARRYSASGASQGVEFFVNRFTTGEQSLPAVASAAGGDFVVTWQGNGPGDGYGIYALRFNSFRVPQGQEFRVNTFTTGAQRDVSVAMSADGDIAVAWTSSSQDPDGSSGVYAQRFDAAGVAHGGEFRVNSVTTGTQRSPSVAMDVAGDFVVAFTGGYQIFTRRYSAAGVAQGEEFRTDLPGGGPKDSAAAAMDANGGFLVTWTDGVIGNGNDGSGSGVYARSYNATGTALGGEFPVNTFTTSNQSNPSAAMDADGDAVIAWQSNAQDGSLNGVYAQRYDQSNPDAAPPIVGGLFFGAAQLLPGHELGGPVSSLQMSFSEEMSVVGDTEGPGSATNPANYALTLNGSDVSSRIIFADFSLDPATQSYRTTLSFSPPLESGHYVVSARAALRDGNGNRLDGDLDGLAGADFRFGFSNRLPFEFRVNTFTEQQQFGAAVATDADGDFVVVWQSAGQEGDGYGVFARRYTAAGAPQGDELRVNAQTVANQVAPTVAMGAAGDFVVVWEGNGPGDPTGIFARRFNASGIPQGVEVRVNSFTTGDQLDASVAMDSDGDFVVTWTSPSQDGNAEGVYARRYNASGAPQGGEFRVNTFTAGRQMFPAAASDADGDFVITWTDGGLDGSFSGVYAQRFNSAGIPQGGEFRVNTFTTDRQSDSVVAMDESGDFVIAWQSNLTDGSLYGIYAQRFDAAGVPQGEEFRVNETTAGPQRFPSIAMQADGGFVVAWHQHASGGIFGRRYTSTGAPQGAEFPVDTLDPAFSGRFPSAAMDRVGDLVVAWQTMDFGDTDVYARKYALAAVTESSFRFDTATHRTIFMFNMNVQSSLGTDDLVLENLTTAQTIPSSDISLSYNTSTHSATFGYTGNAGGMPGVLPDGRYRATLMAAGITNPGGVPMAVDHVFEFTFLRGDANGDGRVNLQDFNILAANFGQGPRDYTQGDFNYDSIVNLNDFNVLAARFGTVLPSARTGGRLADDDAADAADAGSSEELLG